MKAVTTPTGARTRITKDGLVLRSPADESTDMMKVCIHTRLGALTTNTMDQEKNEEYLNDAVVVGFSNCCGARVYQPDICSECGEHCEVEQEEDID